MADTIVACSTPWGRSAVAVVRLSGPDALSVGKRMCPHGSPWKPRRLSLRRVSDGTRHIDDALVAWLPGPRSFTGEDIVELSCHGNPVVIEDLIQLAIRMGARPARPGEFTRRAVEHGRMDILQAEALGALISARSAGGVEHVRRAEQTLADSLSEMRESILDLTAELEARLDHPGEDLSLTDDENVAIALRKLSAEARELSDDWRVGQLQIEGASVALVGPVNAGKSTLFNALLGRHRAIVSAEEGTTRDVVEGTVVWDGVEITFLDTAGIRERPGELESAGMELARGMRASADLHLVVLPRHLPLGPNGQSTLQEVAGCRSLVVLSQVDRESDACVLPNAAESVVEVSATTGTGMTQLRRAIQDSLGLLTPRGQRVALTTQRQHDLCLSLARATEDAAAALMGPLGPAVAAESCVHALDRLAELTGDDVREDVLDRMFSRFCIGK